MYTTKSAAYFSLLIAAFCSITNQRILAGNCLPHPDDPTATTLGVMTVVIELGMPSGDLYPQGGGCRAQTEVCVMRTSSGRTDYLIQAGTIRFTGDCDPIVDTMKARDLFNLLATQAIRQGLDSGYISCPSSCIAPVGTQVYAPACVSRSGSGANTLFALCTATTYCARTYTVCCPNSPGSPTITLLNSTSAGCTAAGAWCESTCP